MVGVVAALRVTPPGGYWVRARVRARVRVRVRIRTGLSLRLGLGLGLGLVCMCPHPSLSCSCMYPSACSEVWRGLGRDRGECRSVGTPAPPVQGSQQDRERPEHVRTLGALTHLNPTPYPSTHYEVPTDPPGRPASDLGDVWRYREIHGDMGRYMDI